MNTPVIFSPRVINTLQSLPVADRRAVTLAIAYDLILGDDSGSELTAIQHLAYTLIKEYVNRDTVKLNNFNRVS